MINLKETLFNRAFKNSLKLQTIAWLVVLANGSCNRINPTEPIPSYIFIPQIELQVAADGSQGSPSNGIEDAWVFANSELIGVFELPALVPILENGNTRISISAGVKRNGRSNDRIAFPFYEPFNLEINLQAGLVDTISPVISYRETAQFKWIEDFEDFSNSFTGTDPSATVDSMFIVNSPEEVFEWDGRDNRASGKVILGSGKQYFHNATVNEFDLPREGKEVYLEANFKSDAPLQFGLIPSETRTFGEIPVFIGFATEGEWKKVYISLKEDINIPDFNRDNFKVFISAFSDSDSDTASVLIDNFKIVYFE
jgi:hypothetical protein